MRADYATQDVKRLQNLGRLYQQPIVVPTNTPGTRISSARSVSASPRLGPLDLKWRWLRDHHDQLKRRAPGCRGALKLLCAAFRSQALANSGICKAPK